MKIAIKTTIALLLFGCLMDVPYGYFQFVRLASTVAFLWMAYEADKQKRKILVAVSIGCAILMNPVFKIHFVRRVWNNIDVAVAIGLLIWSTVDLVEKKKVDNPLKY